MAEAGLSINNHSCIRIRLDPTRVRGRRAAGQPALVLPLEVRLAPIPSSRYTLLRLGGRLRDYEREDIAQLDAGPLALTASQSEYFNQVEITADLDRVRAECLERARNGNDARLHLSLKALLWTPQQEGGAEFQIAEDGAGLPVAIPKSTWAEQVVTPWKIDGIAVVEIRFSERFRTAFPACRDHVLAAERLYASGQWKQVLAELYSGFEAAAGASGCAKPDQAFFASFLSDLHGEKQKATKLALDKFVEFLHLGRHVPSGASKPLEINQHDARFALNMALSVFEYLSSVR